MLPRIFHNVFERLGFRCLRHQVIFHSQLNQVCLLLMHLCFGQYQGKDEYFHPSKVWISQSCSLAVGALNEIGKASA